MTKHPHKATLWRYEGVDMNNMPSYAEPLVVNVRWEEEERLITDNTGKEIQGRGTIYFPEKLFKINDYIALGEHTDQFPISGSFEIKNQRSISNLSGTKWEYRALV